MRSFFECICKPKRRGQISRHERTHATRAQSGDGIVDCWIIGRTIERIALEPDERRNKCGNFPIRNMSSEKNGRAFALTNLIEKSKCLRVVYDVGTIELFISANSNPIEMREFGSDPSNVVPSFTENLINFHHRLIWKSGSEVGATKLMSWKMWADLAHQQPKTIGDSDAIDRSGQPQHRNDQSTDNWIEG